MTTTPREEALLRVARIKALAYGLDEGTFFVGEPLDQRLGLMLADGLWSVGWFERGTYDAEYSTRDLEGAVRCLVERVRQHRAFTDEILARRTDEGSGSAR